MGGRRRQPAACGCRALWIRLGSVVTIEGEGLVPGSLVMSVPEGVSAVLSALTGAGFETVLVGGCVRDTLMGVAPHDFDVATQARPEQVASVFERLGVGVDPTGIRQGSVTVLSGGEGVEVTTYRIDGAYDDQRHCDVTFTTSLAQDLARRDFTINAMALLPAGTGSFELVDEFGGEGDLARGLIRCVGDPRRRFGEDALRMLRAVRFAARFGFDLEPATHAALLEELPGVDTVSVERRTDELVRTLAAAHAGQALLSCTPLAFRVVPELAERQEGRSWELTVRTVDALERRGDPALLVAALLDGCSIPEEALARNLRLTADETRRARLLLRFVPDLVAYDQGSLTLLAHRLADCLASNDEVLDLLDELLCLRKAELKARDGDTAAELRRVADGFEALARMRENGVCLRTRDLALKGSDVIALGVAPGPDVGRILGALLDLVVAGELPNERPTLEQAARELVSRS